MDYLMIMFAIFCVFTCVFAWVHIDMYVVMFSCGAQRIASSTIHLILEAGSLTGLKLTKGTRLSAQ